MLSEVIVGILIVLIFLSKERSYFFTLTRVMLCIVTTMKLGQPVTAMSRSLRAFGVLVGVSLSMNMRSDECSRMVSVLVDVSLRVHVGTNTRTATRTLLAWTVGWGSHRQSAEAPVPKIKGQAMQRPESLMPSKQRIKENFDEGSGRNQKEKGCRFGQESNGRSRLEGFEVSKGWQSRLSKCASA